MTAWTRADSAALDAQIRTQYPNRRPLQYDPAIAAVINPEGEKLPRGIRQATIANCVECQRRIWCSRKPMPPNLIRHKGFGLCSTCYMRRRNGVKQPHAFRITEDQASA